MTDRPLVVLVKTASRLRAAGLHNAFDLSPKQLAWEFRRRADDDRIDLWLAAVATAIGMGGEKKDWKAIEP